MVESGKSLVGNRVNTNIRERERLPSERLIFLSVQTVRYEDRRLFVAMKSA